MVVSAFLSELAKGEAEDFKLTYTRQLGLLYLRPLMPSTLVLVDGTHMINVRLIVGQGSIELLEFCPGVGASEFRLNWRESRALRRAVLLWSEKVDPDRLIVDVMD